MKEPTIIGHQAAREFLTKSLVSGRLAQAYLFVGPAKVGKKKLAQWLVSQVMEQSGDALNQFNVRVIDRALNPKTGKKNKDISLEQIKEAQDFLSHSSLTGKIKAVIIEGAESLNPHAANALLKILEEPRPDCLRILLTANTEETLPTLVSRCQIIRFNPVANVEIEQALVMLGASSDQASEISRLAFGLPGRAIEFYRESKKLAAYKKHCQDLVKIFTSPLQDSWQLLATNLKNKKDHQEARANLINILENWALACRDLLLSRVGGESLVANSELAGVLKNDGGVSARRISRIIPRIWQSIELLNQNIHPALVLENLVLDIRI